MTIRAKDTVTTRYTVDPLNNLTLDVIRTKVKIAKQRMIKAGYIVKVMWSGDKQEYLLVAKPCEVAYALGLTVDLKV